MYRFLLLLPLAACGTANLPPCYDDSGHVPYLSCERERGDQPAPERERTVPDDDGEEPCDDCGPDDDPEPNSETHPDEYREWRERQGRPLP